MRGREGGREGRREGRNPGSCKERVRVSLEIPSKTGRTGYRRVTQW